MERVRIRATSRPSTEAEIIATAANSRRAGLSVWEEPTGICERSGGVMLAPFFSKELNKSEIRNRGPARRVGTPEENIDPPETD